MMQSLESTARVYIYILGSNLRTKNNLIENIKRITKNICDSIFGVCQKLESF